MNVERETVTLERVPTEGEFLDVVEAALKPCECLTPKVRGMVCQPCTARSILNGVVSLAETLK